MSLPTVAHHLLLLMLAVGFTSAKGQASTTVITATRDEINANYVTCVKRICEHYFHAEHAMKGSLIIMSITAATTPFQSSVIGSWGEDAAHKFSVMVKNPRTHHHNASHVSEKVGIFAVFYAIFKYQNNQSRRDIDDLQAQNYFMFCDTVAKDVNASVHQWHSLPTWNPMAQVVVLFTQPLAAGPLLREVDAVLRMLLDFGMLNVNVLAETAGTTAVQVYTWHPYGAGNCAKSVRDILVSDRCAYDTQPGAEIRFRPQRKVSKIPATLNGCPLRVAASVWEPYVVFDGTTGRFTSGIEVLLIGTIATVLQLRPHFVRIAANRENRMPGGANDGYAQLANRWV